MRRYAVDVLVVVATLIVCLALYTAYQDHLRINSMWQWILAQEQARAQFQVPSQPAPEPTKRP